MDKVLDFLGNLQLIELSKDPKVLLAAGAVFLLALLMRWKFVALFIFGLAAIAVVFRYYGGGGDATTSLGHVILFLGSLVAVGFVLIYLIFIRGE